MDSSSELIPFSIETEGAPVVEDAIYSLLVEAPFGIYITVNMKSFYLLIRGRGLVFVTGDFSETTDEEFDELVNDILEAYSA